VIDPTTASAFQFFDQDIPWLLDHWAEHQPDKAFLIWEPKDGGPRTWTYRQFVDDVAKVAAGLHARGVGLGDKVLIHADNCPEAVLAWYACARLGAVAVTTNTRSVANEVNYFATHTGAVGAITQPQHVAVVREAVPDIGWTLVTADDSGVPAAPGTADHGFEGFDSLYGDPATVPDRPADPLLPAGILFTSGTTSRPKAVVHSHGNALWAARSAPDNIDLDADSVYLAFLPFFHVNSQSWAIWSTLGVGGTVVMQPKFSASRFWEVIQTHGVTHISLIPFVFKAIAPQPIPEHTVRVGVFGLVMPELDDWLQMRVVSAYGMTELVTHTIHTNPFEHYPRMSMGKPTPGYEVLVIDPDTEKVCGKDEIGELWVRGTRGIQVFLGYYDNDEANAVSFTDDGWFRTGDLVKVTDGGNFVYCDRDKDALKVGGENVSAREVEDACRLAGGIADIAVVAKTHEMLDMVPVAFVIKADPGADDDELAAAIIQSCKENLSDFKVPRAVYFVEEFPTATLDKVAKNELRALADERPPVA
jgi:crotonobetaine/carnitine-CoA ligase